MPKLKAAGGGAVARAIPVRALMVDDFVRAYGIGRSKCYELIRTGKLVSVTVGGRRLIPVDAAEALLTGDGSRKIRDFGASKSAAGE
jgi:hypothetical protein